jgi:hypothetical protein
MKTEQQPREDSVETTDRDTPRDRRSLITTALTVLAGVGVAALPAKAQTGAAVRIGVNNPAGATATVLSMSNTADNAFVVSNSGIGAASAIWGIGNGPSKMGVFGLAQGGGFAAVLARAENSQFGIVADTDNGTSAGAAFANTGGGAALQIQGRIKVSNPGGTGVVPAAGTVVGSAGQSAIVVSKPFVKADTIVFASITGDPKGAVIQWIELRPGVGFTIHLAGVLGASTPFVYLVIEQS